MVHAGAEVSELCSRSAGPKSVQERGAAVNAGAATAEQNDGPDSW